MTLNGNLAHNKQLINSSLVDKYLNEKGRVET